MYHFSACEYFREKSVRAAKDNRTCTRSLALDIPLGEIIS